MWAEYQPGAKARPGQGRRRPQLLLFAAAAVVLLAAFIIIESRSEHALMPLRILRNRDRSAANLIMLFVGTAMFGMFFFLTLFVQTVWGYSALKTGITCLPLVSAVMVMAGVSAALVPRIGARPLLLAGSAAAAGGMFWLSRISEHSTYATGLLGPMLVTAAGLGMLFMPLTLVALSRVSDRDAGLAASLPNVGQQVGGSIGLAILGTVAWTVVADTARNSAAAAAAATKAGHTQLRLQLELLGWYPLCNGARIDCYPSGMARDMGEGRKVSVLSQTLDKLPLVPTFEPADREKIGTVAEQDANFKRLLAWRTRRPA